MQVSDNELFALGEILYERYKTGIHQSNWSSIEEMQYFDFFYLPHKIILLGLACAYDELMYHSFAKRLGNLRQECTGNIRQSYVDLISFWISAILTNPQIRELSKKYVDLDYDMTATKLSS